ncbi:FAD-dependent oxidoreductase [Actinopolymorpha singaporensis]
MATGPEQVTEQATESVSAQVTEPLPATTASSARRRVLVVGAGVVGLTCAVALAGDGFEVNVVARDLPPETTSAVAAALWFPYRALPQDRVTAWAAASYDRFTRLAREEESAGVDLVPGAELVRTTSSEPWWAAAVPGLRPLSEPPDGYAGGWEFEAPVVDTGIYLPWLLARLTALGGTLTRQALPALPDNAPILVNCTGLAARALARDRSVTPVRGQLVVLDQVGVTRWWADDTDPGRPLYVVPRRRSVVVGGTAEPGDWDTRPRPETTRDLLAAAARLEPALARARVLRERVGLRPARPAVRVEAQASEPGRLVVHCYGHGGSGVTVSWGCAAEVVGLVRAHVG